MVFFNWQHKTIYSFLRYLIYLLVKGAAIFESIFWKYLLIFNFILNFLKRFPVTGTRKSILIRSFVYLIGCYLRLSNTILLRSIKYQK